MKFTITAVTALLLTSTAATAGGIDRGGNAYSALFEDGNYVELSFSSVRPEVSGDYPAGLGGGSTGNMSEDFTSAGVALKFAINDNFDAALFINQPYGANANYGQGFYNGLTAEWESKQIAAVLKYQVNPNISVYGGVRSVESSATIQIPSLLTTSGTQTDPVFTYNATTDKSRETGYIVGAAYEKPEIALRVALTYESGISHEFATTETLPSVTGANVFPGTTTIEMPQSVTLDFQSGVAANTLVFGSVKWSEWSVWSVTAPLYSQLNPTDPEITGLDNDVFTYRLGVGQKINDNLSVFGRVTYEKSTGDVASRLSPTDGTTSIGIGGTYTMDAMKITAGIEYAMLGDATDATGVAFADNTALGLGVSIGYSF